MGVSKQPAASGAKPSPSLTGEAYHDQITAGRQAAPIRARFHRLLDHILAPCAEVLDFGAGTGIDARVLAELGHRVQVFEPDLAMLTYLKKHCACAIDAGQIAVISEVTQADPADAIIANFAVFNLAPDRARIFRQLHSVLKPDGFILASLLNPWFTGDVRYPWWRRNLPRLITHGGYSVVGGNGNIDRLTARTFALEAQPWFDLARVDPAGLSILRSPYVFVRLNRRPC